MNKRTPSLVLNNCRLGDVKFAQTLETLVCISLNNLTFMLFSYYFKMCLTVCDLLCDCYKTLDSIIDLTVYYKTMQLTMFPLVQRSINKVKHVHSNNMR